MQTQYSTYRTLLAPVSGHGLSEAEAKDILRQILSYLIELHDRNQSHGAISLDTVAYDYRRMEIILLAANGENHPSYLAPEVTQTQQINPTADVYALGVVIIVLLTGFPPEALKSQNGAWKWQELCNVSDQLAQFLNVALFASPLLRYTNAGQMLRSLQPIINPSESTITTPPDRQSSLLMPPALIPNLLSNNSLALTLLSPKPQSLETFNSKQNIIHKLKRLKAVSSNSQIFIKARVSKDPPQAASKGKTKIFLTVLLGIAITAISGVGAYLYIQTQAIDAAKENLEFANAVNQLTNKTISNIYEERKADGAAQELITLAKDKYENTGDLSESRKILQTIQYDSRMRSQADKLLARWEEDSEKNQVLIQKAETARKDEKWQDVIDTIKSISPTPYWQSRGKAIIEEAQQKLVNRNVAPSSQPVASPLPTVELPRDPTPETYNPTPETYNPPPPETYNPPPDKSDTPPVPPAPRVAN
jgi:serine/threonine protein kinase